MSRGLRCLWLGLFIKSPHLVTCWYAASPPSHVHGVVEEEREGDRDTAALSFSSYLMPLFQTITMTVTMYEHTCTHLSTVRCGVVNSTGFYLWSYCLWESVRLLGRGQLLYPQVCPECLPATAAQSVILFTKASTVIPHQTRTIYQRCTVVVLNIRCMDWVFACASVRITCGLISWPSHPVWSPCCCSGCHVIYCMLC